MALTREQLGVMARTVGLEIPEADLDNVMLRLSAMLAAMDAIERELGPVMDRTEPVPPVYPHEEF
jgi:hypothetical protein